VARKPCMRCLRSLGMPFMCTTSLSPGGAPLNRPLRPYTDHEDGESGLSESRDCGSQEAVSLNSKDNRSSDLGIGRLSALGGVGAGRSVRHSSSRLPRRAGRRLDRRVLSVWRQRCASPGQGAGAGQRAWRWLVTWPVSSGSLPGRHEMGPVPSTGPSVRLSRGRAAS
jgi:hypothetical protein